MSFRIEQKQDESYWLRMRCFSLKEWKLASQVGNSLVKIGNERRCTWGAVNDQHITFGARTWHDYRKKENAVLCIPREISVRNCSVWVPPCKTQILNISCNSDYPCSWRAFRQIQRKVKYRCNEVLYENGLGELFVLQRKQKEEMLLFFRDRKEWKEKLL